MQAERRCVFGQNNKLFRTGFCAFLMLPGNHQPNGNPMYVRAFAFNNAERSPHYFGAKGDRSPSGAFQHESTALFYANDPIILLPSQCDEVADPARKLTKRDAAWYERYLDLKDYYSVHNHSDVPAKFPQNPKLSRWVRNQREKFNSGAPSLTMEKIEKLNSLNFTWQTKLVWMKHFADLKEYKRLHGDLLVNPKSSLGKWLFSQKQAYRMHLMGVQTHLTLKRIEALVSVGVDFDTGTKQSSSDSDLVWATRLRELADFKREYFHCSVPYRWRDGKLGSWCATQRSAYRLKKKGKYSPLTDAREEALNKIGFDWDLTETTWNNRFDELRQYKAKYGNCLVPQKCDEFPSLGPWVAAQRRQHKFLLAGEKTNLTAERKAKLNGLDFTWSVIQRKKSRSSADDTHQVESSEPESMGYEDDAALKYWRDRFRNFR